MWIRTLDPEASDYAKREKRYARHVAAIKRRIRGPAFDWLIEDKLHDAELVGLVFDTANQEACLTFDYVGEWLRRGRRFIRPKTQRLRFMFSGISDFSVTMPSAGRISLNGAEYIIGELNTSPERRRKGGRWSITMVLSNESVAEVSFLFRTVHLRKQLLPPAAER